MAARILLDICWISARTLIVWGARRLRPRADEEAMAAEIEGTRRRSMPTSATRP